MIQLVLHLVGDYLLQNDWMALNKKKPGLKGFVACLVHCLIYSLPFLLISTPRQWVIIFVSHFIIDRWGFVKWFMNAIGQKKFAEPPMAPWSIIAVDNTFHLLFNFISLTYL
jgi:hypothetical protein